MSILRKVISVLRIANPVTWKQVKEQLLEVYTNAPKEEIERPLTKEEKELIANFLKQAEALLK